MGNLFGPKFEAAIAAYLLGLVCNVFSTEAREAAKALGPVEIPADWREDPSLIGMEIAAYASMSCMSTFEILKYIVVGTQD